MTAREREREEKVEKCHDEEENLMRNFFAKSSLKDCKRKVWNYFFDENNWQTFLI